EPEIADPRGRVDELGLGDALDVDVAADQPEAPEGAVAPLDAQLDGAPLGPLEAVGGLVQAQPAEGQAAHADDQVARPEARLPRRAPPDHTEQPQTRLVELQLDPQADEV